MSTVLSPFVLRLSNKKRMSPYHPVILSPVILCLLGSSPPFSVLSVPLW